MLKKNSRNALKNNLCPFLMVIDVKANEFNEGKQLVAKCDRTGTKQ